MTAFAILALPLLAVLPIDSRDTVNISLFSLFKPELVQVRIVSGEVAALQTAGLASDRAIGRDKLIKIRLAGNRLNLVIAGADGAVEQSAETSAVRIVPQQSAMLEIALPGKIKRTVHGTVVFDAGVDGRGPLRILLSTRREAAVSSVVAAETSGRNPAALKALAVVVRTFMRFHSGRHSAEGFDFCDTTHCQLYRAEQDLADRLDSHSISQAVARTAGQVLNYKGRAIEGYYTAACGGLSATPSMVWGGSTVYPYGRIKCRWCLQSRFGRWVRAANAVAILEALAEFMSIKLSPAAGLRASADQVTGLVKSITVTDKNRSVVLSANSFRRAIGLRLGWSTVLSQTFTVERRGARFVFKGVGFGSQVGFCEEGADAQAAVGHTYREILSFYYPGADIAELTTDE